MTNSEQTTRLISKTTPCPSGEENLIENRRLQKMTGNNKELFQEVAELLELFGLDELSALLEKSKLEMMSGSKVSPGNSLLEGLSLSETPIEQEILQIKVAAGEEHVQLLLEKIREQARALSKLEKIMDNRVKELLNVNRIQREDIANAQALSRIFCDELSEANQQLSMNGRELFYRNQEIEELREERSKQDTLNMQIMAIITKGNPETPEKTLQQLRKVLGISAPKKTRTKSAKTTPQKVTEEALALGTVIGSTIATEDEPATKIPGGQEVG
jgi:hypothetical protein